jgi:hypothetical protein
MIPVPTITVVVDIALISTLLSCQGKRVKRLENYARLAIYFDCGYNIVLEDNDVVFRWWARHASIEDEVYDGIVHEQSPHYTRDY